MLTMFGFTAAVIAVLGAVLWGLPAVQRSSERGRVLKARRQARESERG